MVSSLLLLALAAGSGLAQVRMERRAISPQPPQEGEDHDVPPEQDEPLLMPCCRDEPLRADRTEVTLGYLTAVKGNLVNRLRTLPSPA